MNAKIHELLQIFSLAHHKMGGSECVIYFIHLDEYNNSKVLFILTGSAGMLYSHNIYPPQGDSKAGCLGDIN